MASTQAIFGGGSDNDTSPVYPGLFSCTMRRVPNGHLAPLVTASPTVNKIRVKDGKKRVSEFERSDANATRSSAALYRGGILGKRKYEQLRSTISTAVDLSSPKRRRTAITVGDMRIPTLLPYAKLSKKIRSLDIGDVIPLQNLEDSEPVYGRHRRLEWLLKSVASVLLSNPMSRSRFGKEEGAFRFAIGADGAPFGKSQDATAYCISLLNEGARVASDHHNYLLCLADCSEDHPVMEQYAKELKEEIDDVKTRCYDIHGVNRTFTPALMPSDMKWLASIAGELNNSATYFSTFANVHKGNSGDLKGTLGNGPPDLCRPWSFDQRCKDADAITAFKTSNPDCTRVRVREEIRSGSSRQEYRPLLGEYIDLAKAEPLHCTNNAWGAIFALLLQEAHARTKLPSKVKLLADMPVNCVVVQFLRALKGKVGAHRLHKKLVKHLSAEETYNKVFNYRFTGRDSRDLCRSFHHLRMPLQKGDDDFRLHAMAHAAEQLGEATALMNRVHITAAEVES